MCEEEEEKYFTIVIYEIEYVCFACARYSVEEITFEHQFHLNIYYSTESETD